MDLTSLARAVKRIPMKIEIAHATKMSMNDAEEIRAELALGEKQQVLAARYGVSQSMISHIKRRHRWRGPL